MASWHKSQEETGRSREVNRAAKALLANQKRGNAEEEGGGEREGKRRRGARVIASEQSVLCFCVVFLLYTFSQFFFCCLDLPPPGASLLMNDFGLTACLEFKPTFAIIVYLLSGSIRGHPCCPTTLTP